MPKHDVVVIGGSSGGVQALTAIVAGLPDDFPAAVFVVVHIPPDAPSRLPVILNRSGRLPAAHAVDQEPVRRGRIYVAPPGMQMYVHEGRISVRRGPAENLHRPAIDPLFRTAAHHYGGRVIGVVLSGSLDDGAAGLLAIKRGGGIAVVQDPVDAETPAMPAAAIQAVPDADHVVPHADIAGLLVHLTRKEAATDLPGEVALETVEEAMAPRDAYRSEELGLASAFTCPDCHGTLWEINDSSGRIRYRCRVGHGFSVEAMLAAQSDAVERALWAALRALEERSALMDKLARDSRRRGNETFAARFDERRKQTEEDVRLLHDVIVGGKTLDQEEPDGALKD